MPQPDLTPKLRRLALINVCLGQFMSALDSRSVTVALPTLSVYFDVSLAVVQWVPLAYQLTIVGLVLSMARLGDKLGRKKIYALGFVLLGVGSASCGLSGQLWQIIGFRVVEAVGGALVLANGRAIASTLYAREGRGRALGMMSMSFHHRAVRRRVSCRRRWLALDFFHEPAGGYRGGVDGLESVAGIGDRKA